MSDASVRAALRSDAAIVLVEAPAGCGKTFQGAEYARDISTPAGRILILTHTHAACSVFSERTRNTSVRVDIRTIDSVIAQIAAAYRVGLGLPEDIAAWVREHDNGYAELANKVATLLGRHPMIAASLAQRHPIVICDEHQDSSGAQHAVIMALRGHGSRLRLFADPMQRIFRDAGASTFSSSTWTELMRDADASEELDTPHRWSTGCSELGRWTLDARNALKAGRQLDLRSGLPRSVTVVFAENLAQRNLEYQLSAVHRRQIDTFEQSASSLLILTHHNQTARSLRSFFNRRIPLWEGHTRSALERLVDDLRAGQGDGAAVAKAVVHFMGSVGKGFSPTGFGDILQQEVEERCTRRRRGKPALIQELARFAIDEADHRGAARMLRRISELRDGNRSFAGIEIDCHKEFWEAIRLGGFETVEDGLAEITHRRTYARARPPEKAISTIHKAKGLECGSVVVIPCDGRTFPNSPDARCLLYVALSRAKSKLMLVVSRDNPSPLLLV